MSASSKYWEQNRTDLTGSNMLLYKPNAVLGISCWSHFFYQWRLHVISACIKFSNGLKRWSGHLQIYDKLTVANPDELPHLMGWHSQASLLWSLLVRLKICVMIIELHLQKGFDSLVPFWLLCLETSKIYGNKHVQSP